MIRIAVIAEAGVNHNGHLELACRLVDAAVAAGADIVKFQSFKADRLVAPNMPKAPYQRLTTGNAQSQYEMLRSLELNADAQLELACYCEERGIEFLSTPFDLDSLDFLVRRVGVRRLKIGSGDLTDGPLLLAAARTGLPVILSTGMADIEEVGRALAVLAHGYLGCNDFSHSAFVKSFENGNARALLQGRVTLLQCTTEYPAPLDSINLRAMDTMAERFGLAVGLSDHSEGVLVPAMAVARGARVVEKHLTLDRTMPGPDHSASLEPHAFRHMVENIRAVEQALGDGVKRPAAVELHNIPLARKCVVAARDVAEGDLFTDENLTTLRAEGFVSPLDYWQLLGRRAPRPYRQFEPIENR